MNGKQLLEMLARLANGQARGHGPVAPALAAFDLIAAGRVTQSAFEATAPQAERDCTSVAS